MMFPLDLTCIQCNAPVGKSTESRRYLWRKTGRVFCSTKCGMTYREANLDRSGRAATETTDCTMCGAETTVTGWTLRRLRDTGRAYCSRACSNLYRSARSSETMARTNRKYASARMTARNPMARPDVRAKVSQSLQARGHRPPERGGNGREPPLAELMLLAIVGGLGFTGQVAIPTKQPRGSGYPTCYKVDAGNALLKIAIEADGASHNALTRQAQDRKKDDLLDGLGWKVLRFTNAEILGSPENVWTTVLSTISKLRGSIPTSLME